MFVPFTTFSGGAPPRALGSGRASVTASGGRTLNGARGRLHLTLGDLDGVVVGAFAKLVAGDEEIQSHVRRL